MKNKILFFSAGLLAGLIIGVLFSVAIKELIFQFKEVHLSLNKINLKQSELSQRLDSIQGKLVPDTKKTPNTGFQASTKIQAAKNIILKEKSKPDTQSTVNTILTLPVKNDSEVVVMTNQLISVLSVHLQNKDSSTVNKKTKETDSTIASMSEVSESKEPIEYRLEFWKSPLNFRGYKMSRSKIVIYGISPSGGIIVLSKDGGSYYLINGLTTYRLEYTDNYKPLEQVTDKATLKKLRL